MSATTSIVDADSLRAYKKKTNFFETPEPLADRLAWMIDDVGRGAKILEPSAGRGALIRAVRRAISYPIQPVDFCEIQEDFVGALEADGAARVGSDFEQYRPGPIYDAVIMNPPFKGGLAERHVSHAWECVKPGGKVVAIVGDNAASWIDEEFSGYVTIKEENPKGSFKETGVKTWSYLIHKPLWLATEGRSR